MEEIIQEVNEKYELLKNDLKINDKIKPYYLALKHNQNLVNELYSKYKNAQNSIKLYKLKSGAFKLEYGVHQKKYNQVMTAKICFVLMFELLVLLDDDNAEYFIKSIVLLTSSLELEQ